MADNPIETAASELQKWLDQLEAIFKAYQKEKAKMEAKLAQEAKDALSANKEMMRGEAEKAKFDSIMKELKEIKEGAAKLPDGPEKKALDEQINAAEQQMEQEVNGPDVDVSELNEVAGPEVEDAFSPDVDVSELNEVAGPELEDAFEAAEGVQEGLEEGVKALEEGLKGVTDAVQSIGGAAGGGLDLGGGGAPAIAGADGGGLTKIGSSLGDSAGGGAAEWKPGSVGEELKKQGMEIKRPGGPKIGQQREQAPKIGGHRR